MKYRAVLFDFDGTLTPSLPLWVKVFHLVLQRFGLSMSDAEIVRRFFYRDWKELALDLQIDYPLLEEAIHAGLREAFKEAELFPSVRPVIEHCRERGVKTALVTSAPRAVIDHVMPRLKLDELFDSIVTANDVRDFKPHPEALHKALAALGTTAVDAIMIGDSVADMLAGKAAGTATALFLPDDHQEFYHFDTLRATEPDHIFTAHEELFEIVGGQRS